MSYVSRMTPRKALLIFAVLSGLATIPAGVVDSGAQEVLDEPIAVVGDRLILRSEWETQIALYAMQAQKNVNDQAFRDTLGPAILDQMINDMLLLIVAEQDTTIVLEAAEIDAALEDQMQDVKRRFGSETAFQRALQTEGITERDLRVRYRKDVENQILKQRLMQRKLAEAAVSHGEVREFYEYYKDSLPTRPEGIKLSHILMTVTVSGAAVDSTRSLLTEVLERIRGGLDFSEAARQYSKDASAASGGDLGWFGKGQMVPEFEEAAFALTPGQVSGVVKTAFGLHLIQCVEKNDKRIHARHIILTLSPTAADSADTYRRADSVYRAALDGADFCALAAEFSSDDESKKNCGELGWYPIQEMYEEFKVALRDAKTGDITPPVSTEFGWHILRVLDYREAHRLTLEDDWDGIKQIARQDKTNRILTEWLEEIKSQTHVEILPIKGQTRVVPATSP